MKKKRLLLLVAVLVLALTAGCGGGTTPVAEGDGAGGESGDQYVIGVSMWDNTAQYFAEIINGIKDVANELGNVTLSIQDQGGDATKMVNVIENFMSSNVDAIIICAVAPEAADPLILTAKEAGIPTFAQNHELKNAFCWQTIIEYDYGYAVGKMGGEWIKNHYGDEEVEVAVISFDMLVQGLERTKGIEEGVVEFAPNVKIVARQDSESMQRAFAVTETMLQANPKIKVVLGFDDDTAALGASEALDAYISANGFNRDDFYVGGADAVPEALKKIKDGSSLKGTVDITPYDQGVIAMETTMKYLLGEEVDPIIYVPMKEVTVEVAKSDY